MSLLDDPDPTHADAIARLAAELEAGSLEDRSVLLNLREETRIPGVRRAFQQRLVASTKTTAAKRVEDACGAAPRVLPVLPAQRASVRGAWCVYTKLDSLIDRRLIDDTGIDRRSPPPRIPLLRPIGRADSGAEFSYWTTTAIGADATDLRDRLGLSHFPKGSQVFRVLVDVDADPARPLFTPTALDSGAHPAWRCPPAGHGGPWGMTRDLRDDTASEPELLALPHDGDPREATYVGRVATIPPRGYLAVRLP